jgi:hypothetical protein
MSLTKLIRKGGLLSLANATPATSATETAMAPSPSVASVATVAVAKFAEPDATDVPDPDRCCWPHSLAMNTAEIETLQSRQTRFQRHGLTAAETELLFDQLVQRDRDGDRSLALCLECVHLRRSGTWNCLAWQTAGMSSQQLASASVQLLQRCPGFREAI